MHITAPRRALAPAIWGLALVAALAVWTPGVARAQEGGTSPLAEERAEPVLNDPEVTSGTSDSLLKEPTGDPGTAEPGDGLLGVGSEVLVAGAIAAAAAAALTVFAIRRRRPAADVTAIEEPLPEADDAGVPLTEAQYEGAQDAGAYDVGGAAYAQHTADPYVMSEVVDEPGARADEARSRPFSQLQASVVDMADKAVAETGKQKAVAAKLEAAGSQLRPGEWALVTAGVALAGALGFGLTLGWVLGLTAGTLAVLGAWWRLGRRATKRANLFAEQLPETLQMLAGALRSGMSLMQAMQTIADETDAPTADEFQRVITESRLGRDLGASLRDLAERSGSQDFSWVVTAIEISREVGGDLASILDRVGATIRARNRVRGQVQALSAEGKTSGLILFFLPPAMVGLIAVMNRQYLDEMVTTTDGQIMLIASGVLLLVGGAWMKRLARFVY
jgi:tight adherence protein B